MSELGRPRGIIVCGANGSGKTTLGRELSRILGFKHMDHEAYAFKESEIPYAEQRPYEECLERMLADIEKHGSFVLSAVTGDFGERIPHYYELAVCLSAPLQLRLERIKQREYERHGERVKKGGDMYESRLRFIDFVASRPASGIDRWLQTLACPVIYADGAADFRINAAKIAGRFAGTPGHIRQNAP